MTDHPAEPIPEDSVAFTVVLILMAGVCDFFAEAKRRYLARPPAQHPDIDAMEERANRDMAVDRMRARQ